MLCPREPALTARLLWRYATSRALLWAVLGCVPLAIVATLLPSWIPLILSTNQASIRTTSLIGLVPAVILGRTLELDVSEFEGVFRRTVRRLRCAHLALVAAASAMFVTGALIWRSPVSACVGGWFGTLGFIGLGLVGAAVVRGPSWLVPGVVAGAMYLMGSTANGETRFWAWYLLADPSATKMLIDAALFLIGGSLLLFARRFQPGE